MDIHFSSICDYRLTKCFLIGVVGYLSGLGVLGPTDEPRDWKWVLEELSTHHRNISMPYFRTEATATGIMIGPCHIIWP